jgi:hypothetical protein
MADNVQTALASVQELRQEIEATKTVSESIKRRRVSTDTEQPTEPTSLEHIDIDNVTKREAHGAFPRWKCWALVQVAPHCVLLCVTVACVDCCCVQAYCEFGSYTKVIKMLLLSWFFFFGTLMPQLEKIMPSRSVLANWVLRFGQVCKERTAKVHSYCHYIQF